MFTILVILVWLFGMLALAPNTNTELMVMFLALALSFDQKLVTDDYTE